MEGRSRCRWWWWWGGGGVVPLLIVRGIRPRMLVKMDTRRHVGSEKRRVSCFCISLPCAWRKWRRPPSDTLTSIRVALQRGSAPSPFSLGRACDGSPPRPGGRGGVRGESRGESDAAERAKPRVAVTGDRDKSCQGCDCGVAADRRRWEGAGGRGDGGKGGECRQVNK